MVGVRLGVAIANCGARSGTNHNDNTWIIHVITNWLQRTTTSNTVGRPRIDLGPEADARIAAMVAANARTEDIARAFDISNATACRRTKPFRGAEASKARHKCLGCDVLTAAKSGKCTACNKAQGKKRGRGRPRQYGPIYFPACPKCSRRTSGLGATGMCASCASTIASRKRNPLLPPRKCRTCAKDTATQQQAYCSDACRPAATRSKYRLKYKSHAYTKNDKHARLQEMIARQGGLCASCKGDGLPRGLVFDHDHATGEPRAALCHGCNSALGLLRESPETIGRLLAFAQWCEAKREAHPGLSEEERERRATRDARNAERLALLRQAPPPPTRRPLRKPTKLQAHDVACDALLAEDAA